MNSSEIFLLSFEAVKERRLRSSLTILMVVVGTGLLVSADGVSEGYNSYLHDEFRKIGANVLAIRPKTSNIEVDQDVLDSMAGVEGVSSLVSYIQEAVLFQSQGGRTDCDSYGFGSFEASPYLSNSLC